jgi:RNA polymerase sigma factor (sigma-70 family)
MKPSKEWFDDLVEQTSGGLARYVDRILVSPDDTQEVLQEAYLKVFLALRKSNRDENFPVALLYTTARNIAVSRLRHQSVVLRSVGAVAIAEELRADIATAEQQVSANERRKSLLLVVNGLPPKCREVFVLRWIHGMSQRDIGEKLGISLSTVEKHLAKGLRQCKIMMTEGQQTAEQDCAAQKARAAS